MQRAAAGSAAFFVLAPGSTAGLVPWLLTGWRHPHGFGLVDGAGAVLALAGLSVAVAAFVQFVREGRGTPAPVAPTQDLVVGGPYRYVRNPMYVAVASMIAGQVVVFRSVSVLIWLGVFVVAVVSFVTWYEEPKLLRVYGERYERYRRAVSGWWPRLRPWRP
ncbi:MAG: isoprenylcysteine carboxyl methyltransferase [Propionibacteriales bacterium]|nr:isoprenylcysteine carboxyl methyltransferase [Propionibacteriales bacterium]